MPSTRFLATEAATIEAGRRLAESLRSADVPRIVIHLRGDLGAGKTTFARGFLAGLGHAGRVPSPTYTLVEPYDLARYRAYHVDLYRLADPAEVDDLGLADLDGPGAVWLIEWPERAAGRLEAPDIVIRLELAGGGRSLCCAARSADGESVLAHKNL